MRERDDRVRDVVDRARERERERERERMKIRKKTCIKKKKQTCNRYQIGSYHK